MTQDKARRLVTIAVWTIAGAVGLAIGVTSVVWPPWS